MSRITIPVAIIEFDEGGHTMWIQSQEGATVLRLKLFGDGKFRCKRECENVVSHVDIISHTEHDVTVCLAEDAND